MNLQSLRHRARELKIELIALALAARHPRTPWYAKLVVAGCVLMFCQSQSWRRAP